MIDVDFIPHFLVVTLQVPEAPDVARTITCRCSFLFAFPFSNHLCSLGLLHFAGMMFTTFIILFIFWKHFEHIMFYDVIQDKANEGKLRIASLCEQVQHHQDKVFNLYQQFDSAFGNFKASKDNGAFQATVKKINSEHKTEVQAMQDLQTKLKNENSEAADKVI